MKRAILIDRDGVINAMVYHAEFGLVDSPANPSEFRLIPGAAEAIRRINEMEYLSIIVSNQPGVAKGKYTMELLGAIKAKMHEELARHGATVDAEYYCLHHPSALLDSHKKICECRKPRPGMLLQAAADLQFDLAESYFIGDGVTDVLAGNRAGCKSFLVNSRKCYLCDELACQKAVPDFIGKDLADAVSGITRLEEGDLTAEETYRFRCHINCD